MKQRITGTVSHRLPVVDELTPLNHKVTARFERCGGNHIPGDEWVQRWTGKGYHSFPVCKKCRVPMVPLHYRWTDRPI